MNGRPGATRCSDVSAYGEGAPALSSAGRPTVVVGATFLHLVAENIFEAVAIFTYSFASRSPKDGASTIRQISIRCWGARRALHSYCAAARGLSYSQSSNVTLQ